MGKEQKINRVTVAGSLADFCLSCQEEYREVRDPAYSKAITQMVKDNPAEALSAAPTYLALAIMGQVKFKDKLQVMAWLREGKVPTLQEFRGVLNANAVVNDILRAIGTRQYDLFANCLIAEFVRQNRKLVVLRPTVEGVGDIYGDARKREMSGGNDGHDPGSNLFDDPETCLMEE